MSFKRGVSCKRVTHEQSEQIVLGAPTFYNLGVDVHFVVGRSFILEFWKGGLDLTGKVGIFRLIFAGVLAFKLHFFVLAAFPFLEAIPVPMRNQVGTLVVRRWELFSCLNFALDFWPAETICAGSGEPGSK